MPSLLPRIPRASFVVLGLLAIVAASGAAAAAEEAITGNRDSIKVIDGDTLLIAGRTIQLAGIDAPELGQLCVHGDQTWHCGLRAAYALHKLIELAADPVVCSHLTETSPTLLTGTCEIGEENISLTLLQGGYAAVPPGSGYFYKAAEEHARGAGLGIWGSRFVLPWNWRDGRRLPQESGLADQVCPIIGTVSADGTKLFHVPTDPDFDALHDSPNSQVRKFCSDEEARAAGWHHPGEIVGGT